MQIHLFNKFQTKFDCLANKKQNKMQETFGPVPFLCVFSRKKKQKRGLVKRYIRCDRATIVDRFSDKILDKTNPK